MLTIFIDADGCAVKEEVYRVASRYLLKVFVVANKPLNIPASPLVEMKVVGAGLDVADDWIAENTQAGDIVITSDIPLADRCVKKQARVLSPKGEEWTEDNIGDAIASRELMQTLRQFGEMRGGPSPMDKKNRSQFLGKLDQVVQSLKRLSRSP